MWHDEDINNECFKQKSVHSVSPTGPQHSLMLQYHTKSSGSHLITPSLSNSSIIETWQQDESQCNPSVSEITPKLTGIKCTCTRK